ncbi:unnamed protein product [Bathycoccus prasinos]
MVRKYDRYGYNRQYKAKPCTRRYPFPYPLPFVDDYSAGAVLEKHISAPPEFTKGDIDTAYGGNRKRSRADVEESQRKRRATNAARKLKYPHPLGANNYGWQRGDTEDGAISKFARYRVRRQALRDARAMREAMEAVPEYDKPGLGLAGRMAKRFRTVKRRVRKANKIMKYIDYLPI